MAEGFSQATGRTYRTLTDQHGQKWGADIEKKSDCPCGPISPKFSAPMKVPQKYLTMVVGDSGKIRINYEQWIQDTEEELRYYDSRKRELAVEIAPSRAAEEYASPSPLLLARLGPKPQAVEPIKARQAGNPWIRGVAGATKPQEAEEHFPAPEEEKATDWGGEVKADTAEFPIYSGFAWICSDSRKYSVKEIPDAEAQAREHQSQLAPVGQAWAA